MYLYQAVGVVIRDPFSLSMILNSLRVATQVRIHMQEQMLHTPGTICKYAKVVTSVTNFLLWGCCQWKDYVPNASTCNGNQEF